MAEQQKQCPRQVSRTPRSREDLVSTTWKMQETKATIDLINNPRMDVIRTQAEKEWEGGNDCQWLKCAVQELTRNRVHPIVFAEALRDLMIDGREKNPKIFIAGPTNYGKLFWFPHCKTYLKRSVIQAIDLAGCWKGWTEFSRRFRWSPEMIHSPMNTYAYDITIKTDTSIVTTSESEIKYIRKFNFTDPAEDETMSISQSDGSCPSSIIRSYWLSKSILHHALHASASWPYWENFEFLQAYS